LKKAWFVFLVLALFLLDGCKGAKQEAGPEEPLEKQTKVLAIVNGEDITEADFETELAGKPGSYRRRAESEDGKRQILERLIEQRLLMQAAKKEEITDDPEINAKVRAYKERLVLDALREKILSEQTELSEQEMKDYYEKHKFQFYHPERIWVKQIVFTDRSKAVEVYSELQSEPHRFREVAMKYSEDEASQRRGGDLGYITRGAFPAELEEKIFSLEEKELSEVIEYEGRYYIFQVITRQEAEHRDFDQVKDQIKKRMEYEKRRPKWEEYIEGLRGQAEIEVLD
jgi:peptidyl-prolyl cis-trans isomerase C